MKLSLLFGILVVAASTTESSFAQAPSLAPLSKVKAPDIKATGILEPALAQKISAAVGSNSFSRTQKNNGQDVNQGGADIPAEGGVLVGFEVWEVGGEKWARSLRPYFKTPQGLVAGKDRGYMQAVSDKYLARPGYAVGGLITDSRKRGFQIIFMKVDPATGRFATGTESSYKSQWIGEKTRDKLVTLGGDGRLVIGVFGKTGADCDDIGLIQLD